VAAAPCEERDGREDVVAVPIGEHGRGSGRLCLCPLYYSPTLHSDLSPNNSLRPASKTWGRAPGEGG